MIYFNLIEIPTYWILISVLVFLTVGFLAFKLLYLIVNTQISCILALILTTLTTFILLQGAIIYQSDVINQTKLPKTKKIELTFDLSTLSEANQYIEMRKYYNELIKIKKVIGNIEEEAFTLYSFGVYENNQENYEEAQALFDRSMAAGGHIRYLHNRILKAKGFTYIEQNKLLQASEVFETLLLKTIEINSFSKLSEAEAYYNLGHINNLNHRVAKARSNFTQSLKIIEEFIIEKQSKIDDKPESNYSTAYNDSYIALISLEVENGNYNEAIRIYNAFKNVIDPTKNLELLIKMNESEHQLSKKVQFHKSIKEFDKLYSEIEYAFALDKYYFTIGDDELIYGHIDEARKAFLKSHEIWRIFF